MVRFRYVSESLQLTPTWTKVVRSISTFLARLWRTGALQGVTQDEVFFVKCDRTTIT